MTSLVGRFFSRIRPIKVLVSSGLLTDVLYRHGGNQRDVHTLKNYSLILTFLWWMLEKFALLWKPRVNRYLLELSLLATVSQQLTRYAVRKCATSVSVNTGPKPEWIFWFSKFGGWAYRCVGGLIRDIFPKVGGGLIDEGGLIPE